METQTKIRLPTDRVNQLRQFAQGMDDATLSATLGKIFKFAREQGLISHGIPSVTINTLADGVAIKFKDGPTHGFSFAEAAKIATEIRAYLAGETYGQKTVHVCNTHGSTFMVYGKGGGKAIAVAIPATAKPKTFTRDLALELAELIELEVSKAAGSKAA